jgi:putative transposase
MIPSGTRKITAGNMAPRQQLISLTRHRKRAPKQSTYERIIFGFLTGIMSQKRLTRIAIAIKPATLLRFHRALVKRKYQLSFSNKTVRRPGPKGPSQELIDAIVEMKRRNPCFGYRRLAMQISNAFGCEIDKDVVRRVLSRYFKTSPIGSGPSWLTFIGHMKDSLWSIDFFRALNPFI